MFINYLYRWNVFLLTLETFNLTFWFYEFMYFQKMKAPIIIEKWVFLENEMESYNQEQWLKIVLIVHCSFIVSFVHFREEWY